MVKLRRLPARRTTCDKQFLNQTEACLYLGVGFSTMKRIISENKIPVRRIGKRIIISRDVLRQWAEGSLTTKQTEEVTRQ